MSVSSPRIRRLIAEPPATLRLVWHDGSKTSHDLSAMLRKSWAKPLRDPRIFAAAVLADDGWQIVWPGTDAALSAQGLWDDVHKSADAALWMSAAEFSTWLHEMGWSFAQAADAHGVSKRMLKYYAAGSHVIPKTVWPACMHLAAARARRKAPADAA